MNEEFNALDKFFDNFTNELANHEHKEYLMKDFEEAKGIKVEAL